MMASRYLGWGGVVYNDEFVQSSGIISYGRDVLHRVNEPVKVFGGSYKYNSCNKINKTVIYGGLISNHWGHFLVDFTTRLWFTLINKDNNPIAFVVRERQHIELLSNILRFLELLGIKKDRILLISEPTSFSHVIVPECSYITNRYYSHQFLKVFDFVAENALKEDGHIQVYNKVYFSRMGWHKAKTSEYGEEILVDLFRKNGYHIVSPERCTLDEQIAIIRNSEIVAAIEGTIPHNMLFARNSQQLLIINKTYNINSMQRDVNIMRHLDVTFIDSYISIFPVPMGDGPFTIIYSNELKRYIEDNNLNRPNINVIDKKYQANNIKRAIKIVREEIANSKMQVTYITDDNNSAYFDPSHLIMYYSDYYIPTAKITLIEKIEGKFLLILRIIEKVKYRIVDQLLMRK